MLFFQSSPFPDNHLFKYTLILVAFFAIVGILMKLFSAIENSRGLGEEDEEDDYEMDHWDYDNWDDHHHEHDEFCDHDDYDDD